MNSTLRATCGLTNYFSKSEKTAERSNRIVSPAGKSTTTTANNEAPTIQTTLTDGSLNINSLTASGTPRLMAGRFKFVSLLGKGAFAQTLRMEDQLHPQKRHVAVKVMNAFYSDIGEEEAKLLSRLNGADRSDNCHMVRLYTFFRFGHHFCLVFELLEHKKMQLRRTIQAPFPNSTATAVAAGQSAAVEGLNLLRKLAWQLLVSLMFLKDQGVLHADLKPENILFRSNANMHAKVIDFGNALSINEVSAYYQDFELQSILYRAPEVLVGLPFGFPIDCWSVGMILCEFWLGKPLCTGQNRQQMFEALLPILGPLPYEVYSAGKYFQQSFCTVNYNTFQLDLSDPNDLLKFRIRCLSKALQTRDLLFLQFINELLEYDPERRLTPVNALRHPFLSALFPFDLFERSLAVEAVDMNEILMDAAADTPMRLNRQPLDAANENPITAPEIEDITRPTSAISSITLATLPDSNPGTAANRSTIFPSAQSSFQPCKRHSNEFNSLINYQSTKLVVESDMMDFIETSPEITMHSVAAQTDFHGEEFAQAIIKLKEHPATAATTPASNEPREKSEPHQSPPVSSSSDHVNNQSNEDDVLTDTAEEKENSVAENSSISTSSARSINTLDSAKSVTTNRTSVFNHVDSMEAVAAADLSSPIPTVRSSKKRKLLLLQQQQEQKQQRQSQTEIRTTPSSPRISELLRLNSSFSSSANSAFVVPSKSRRASGSQNVNSRQSTRLERPTIIVMGRTRRQAAAIKQKTNQPTDIVLDRDLLRTKRSMSPSEFL